jgi:hypothetical protein
MPRFSLVFQRFMKGFLSSGFLSLGLPRIAEQRETEFNVPCHHRVVCEVKRWLLQQYQEPPLLGTALNASWGILTRWVGILADGVKSHKRRVVNCGILCGDVIELFSFLGTAHMPFEQTPLSAQQFVVLIKGQPVPKIQTGLKTS